MKLGKLTSAYHLLILLVILTGASPVTADTVNPTGYVFIDIIGIDGDTVSAEGAVFIAADTLGGGEIYGNRDFSNHPIELSPGYYMIAPAAWPTSERATGWFGISDGDTLHFTFHSVPWENEYRDPGDWQEYRPMVPDTVFLKIVNDCPGHMPGLTLIPCDVRPTIVGDNLYQVVYDSRSPMLIWNFPGLGDRTTRIPYRLLFKEEPTVELAIEDIPGLLFEPAVNGSPDQISLLSVNNDEWISSCYRSRRTLIDPTEWGDEALQRYGYVDGRAYFDQKEDGSEHWRILLIFHNRIVVLSERSEPVIHELEEGIMRPIFSPYGRYVLYHDWSDSLDIDEWAYMIDTYTGDVSSIQSGNPMEEQVRYAPAQPERQFFHWWTHLVSCDGSMISVIDDRLKFFNPGLEFSSTVLLPDSFQSGSTYRGRTSDGKYLFLIDPYINHEICAIDENGSVHYRYPIDFWIPAFDKDVHKMAALTHSDVSIWNLRNGAIQNQMSNPGFDRIALSDDGVYLGLSRNSEYFEFRNAEDLEVLYSFSVVSDSTRVEIENIGSDGYCILRFYKCNSFRIGLVSEEDGLIWISPSRDPGFMSEGRTGSISLSNWDSVSAISNDGNRLIYNDGCFIHILDFEKPK